MTKPGNRVAASRQSLLMTGMLYAPDASGSFAGAFTSWVWAALLCVPAQTVALLICDTAMRASTAAVQHTAYGCRKEARCAPQDARDAPDSMPRQP